MAIGKYSLLFVLMILMGTVYKTTGTSCHTVKKHEAIREGLLSDRAICRARRLDFLDRICLNGKLPDHVYCSSAGSCNVFGYNCDGHCLSGNDFIHGEADYSLECNISYEIRKFCDFYLKYEPSIVFYKPKLEELCPDLKSECKKLIDNKWKY